MTGIYLRMDVVHTQSVNRTVNRTDRQLLSLIIDVHVHT